MSVPAVRPPAGELVTHGPGRPLGLKVQPQLRLSMGYRDENRKGAPVKTDYFTVRETEEFQAERLRFFEVFGEKPKEVEIMLPTNLADALDIRHRAWGGGNDTGGVLKAVGQTNFALLGTLGGPDRLNVWGESAEIEEVEISGLDDPFAKELKLELSATFNFGIPKVLGVGGMAAISSKGKQSIDSLFQKLLDLYGIFGERISYAVLPVLFLRKASSRYYDPKVKQWRTSSYFALDLRVPETLDDMFSRLRERDALLLGSGSAAPVSHDSQGPPSTLPGDGARGLGPERAAAEEEAELVEGEVVDETSVPRPPETGSEREPATAAAATTGQHVPGQATLDGRPVPEQLSKITGVLNELSSATSTVAALIDEDSGEISEFEDWPSYARAYCMVVLDVTCPEGEKLLTHLNAEQADQLYTHLDSLVIPF